MKRLLLTAAIVAAFGTAASACPIEIDGNATTTTHDRHTGTHAGAGITMIAQPPQTSIPKRDIHTASGSMTVRWNTAPAKTAAAPLARLHLRAALPPLDLTL